MKRSIFAVVAATLLMLMLMLMAMPAQAGPINKLSSSGWWDVWYGTSDRDGSPTCRMSAKLHWDNGTTGNVYVKWDEQHGTRWQVWRSDLSMPQGSTVPMSVTFIEFRRNVSPPQTITAAAKVLDEPSLISFDINKDDLIPFLKQFGDAEQMMISFPQGDAQWTMNMDGSRNAASSFKQCITSISNAAPTQPDLLPVPRRVSPTDEEIAAIIVQISRRRYFGPCPCPYDRARNNSACGRRSAYSRLGGAEPLCYRRDVTPQMIEQHRQRQALR